MNTPPTITAIQQLINEDASTDRCVPLSAMRSLVAGKPDVDQVIINLVLVPTEQRHCVRGQLELSDRDCDASHESERHRHDHGGRERRAIRHEHQLHS